MSETDPLKVQNDPTLHRAEQALFSDIRQLINQAKQRAAVAINTEITLLYWQVGKRIQAEVLQGQRAEYGKRIIVSLSEQLTQTYGRGWSAKQLRHCLHFAETFPEDQIVYTLCRQLSWSHLRLLFYIDDPDKETQAEAILGLALRKDLRVVQPLIDALGDDEPSWMNYKAAWALASPELCPALLAVGQRLPEYEHELWLEAICACGCAPSRLDGVDSR
jgi:DUF1016 N-terminal domain